MKHVRHPKEKYHLTLGTFQLEILQPRKYLKQLVLYFLRHLETFLRAAETAPLEAADTQHQLICVPWLRLQEQHVIMHQQYPIFQDQHAYLNVAFQRKKTIRLFLFQNGLFFQLCRAAYLHPSRKRAMYSISILQEGLCSRTDDVTKNLCIFRKLVDRARDNEKHFICCFSSSV
jgi:hypothetical protein